MSYYYNYYIGHQGKDGLFYPVGPFTADGKLLPVLSRSRNFASDLHDWFAKIPDEKISDELRKHFSYDWNGETETSTIKYIYANELPKGSYIKDGYFLIDDVVTYKEEHDSWDLFYDRIDPEVYAARMQNEIVYGQPKPREDEDDCGHSASDYMYFAYPEYSSAEYEAAVLRQFIDVYEYRIQAGRFVILEDEG